MTETEVNYTYSKTNFHFVDHWEMTLIFVQIYPINLLGLGPNLPFSNQIYEKLEILIACY